MALDIYSLRGMLAGAGSHLQKLDIKIVKDLKRIEQAVRNGEVSPEAVEAYAEAVTKKLEELNSLEISHFEPLLEVHAAELESDKPEDLSATHGSTESGEETISDNSSPLSDDFHDEAKE